MKSTAAALIFLSMTSLCVASCAKSGADASLEKSSATEFSIGYKLLESQCDLKPSLPQVYIFDKSGQLASTELGFSPGSALNIASGNPGPAFKNLQKLDACVSKQGVDFEQWKACGADYCVVRLVPDKGMGECPYCDQTQASLDQFFSAKNSKVLYRNILIAN